MSKRLLAMSLAMLLVGVALGYALSMALPYQLSGQKPKISLSATSVKAGQQYTVTLSGFSANTEIYGMTVNQNPPQTFSAGTTNQNGELTLTANAPETAGIWPLIACDKDHNILATATLAVT